MKDNARARFYFQSKNSVCDCRRPNTHREREKERERGSFESFFFFLEPSSFSSA